MDNHKHYIGKWGWWKYQNDLIENEISDGIRGRKGGILGIKKWFLPASELVEPDNNNLVEVVYSIHVILCLNYLFFKNK